MSLEINGEIIEDDLIEEELRYTLRNLKDQGQTPSLKERDSLLQTIKESLIYKTLLRQEVDKLNLTIDSKLIDREYHIFFNQTSPNEENNIKKYIESKLKESHYIDQICQDITPPQESHLRIFYEDNLEHYFIAKEFRYGEIGFRYTNANLHPHIYEVVSRLREKLLHQEISSSFDEKKIIEILGDSAKKLHSKFFYKEWKTAIRELSQEGLSFFEQLQKTEVSKITDHPGESFFFTPMKMEATSSQHYLGLFIHIEVRHNFIPPFEEIMERVKSDLWEEMRQIQVKSHIRQVMGKSTIRDINYI